MEYIDSKDLDTNERRFIGKNCILLHDELLDSWMDDVNTCPCFVEGSCHGLKTEKFYGRCVEGNMGYQNCPRYHKLTNNQQSSFKPESRQAVLQFNLIILNNQIKN